MFPPAMPIAVMTGGAAGSRSAARTIMINPIQITGVKTAGEPLTQDGAAHRRVHNGPTSAAPGVSPVEVVTLSEFALQGQLAGTRQRRRDTTRSVSSSEQAGAAAAILQALVREQSTGAARAQAHASAERVWNLVTD
jgi:hypothetical protein